jgi:hypothetical protein
MAGKTRARINVNGVPTLRLAILYMVSPVYSLAGLSRINPKFDPTDKLHRPITMPLNQALSFGLKIHPHPRMVSIIRRFVEESFEKMVGDPQAIFRVSLAVHELLENAAKYSSGEEAELQIQSSNDGTFTRIELTNLSTPKHIARLKACIEKIQQASKPFELYQTMMRKTYGMKNESGLGLARIRAEGELDLDIEISGQAVTIIASSPKK